MSTVPPRESPVPPAPSPSLAPPAPSPSLAPPAPSPSAVPAPVPAPSPSAPPPQASPVPQPSPQAPAQSPQSSPVVVTQQPVQPANSPAPSPAQPSPASPVVDQPVRPVARPSPQPSGIVSSGIPATPPQASLAPIPSSIGVQESLENTSTAAPVILWIILPLVLIGILGGLCFCAFVRRRRKESSRRISNDIQAWGDFDYAKLPAKQNATYVLSQNPYKDEPAKYLPNDAVYFDELENHVQVCNSLYADDALQANRKEYFNHSDYPAGMESSFPLNKPITTDIKPTEMHPYSHPEQFGRDSPTLDYIHTIDRGISPPLPDSAEIAGSSENSHSAAPLGNRVPVGNASAKSHKFGCGKTETFNRWNVDLPKQ